MRWKLHWYRQKNKEKDEKETYGFKTPHHPPMMEELKPFEDDMAKLIQNLEFKYSDNALQRRMREDLELIRQSPDVVVEADKTANLYLFNVDEYKAHLNNAITSEHKKADGWK